MAAEWESLGFRPGEGRIVEWQAFDAAGKIVLHTWTNGEAAFDMELQVYRARLENRVDHVVRVIGWSIGSTALLELMGHSDYPSIEAAAEARGAISADWPKRAGVGAYGPLGVPLRAGDDEPGVTR